jgi:hypothetical protein
MSKTNYENQQHEPQHEPQQPLQSPNRWSQMAGQILESLTDKNMTATMQFQNLEIDLPRTQGPKGKDLGGAKWVVNGKIIWTTELHKT